MPRQWRSAVRPARSTRQDAFRKNIEGQQNFENETFYFVYDSFYKFYSCNMRIYGAASAVVGQKIVPLRVNLVDSIEPFHCAFADMDRQSRAQVIDET